MKKILLMVAVIMVVSTMFTGCGKKETETQPQVTQTTNIDSPVVGVWRHQDVPESPHYKTWVMKLNKDGTYTTESDTYDSDQGKTSHTVSFGEKGKYALAVSENVILFISDTGRTRSEHFEVVKENGEERLVFKDSTGKNKASASSGGKIYDLIFIKEK